MASELFKEAQEALVLAEWAAEASPVSPASGADTVVQAAGAARAAGWLGAGAEAVVSPSSDPSNGPHGSPCSAPAGESGGFPGGGQARTPAEAWAPAPAVEPATPPEPERESSLPLLAASTVRDDAGGRATLWFGAGDGDNAPAAPPAARGSRRGQVEPEPEAQPREEGGWAARRLS